MANTDRLLNHENAVNVIETLTAINNTLYNPDDWIDKSWATASDETIVSLVAKLDAGTITRDDLPWAVGDERVVHLSAMAATGVGESHVEQDVTFVIMNVGGKTLADGVTECNYVVGMKNCLLEKGYMNSTNTNLGSWNGSARRAWCNSIFYNAVPESIRSIFKQFNCLTAQTYNGSTNQTTQDYFALPAAAEVFKGDPTYGQGGTAGSRSTASSNLTEFNALSRWTWYETTANRIKTLSDSGSADYWWERSPYYDNSSSFCDVANYGNADSSNASYYTYGLAPFGVI